MKTKINLVVKKYGVTFLIIASSIMRYEAFIMFDSSVPCEKSNEVNDFCFDLMALSEFVFVLAVYLSSNGIIKAAVRFVLIALFFSTTNELVGLNEALDSFEYPIFWTVMLGALIYSLSINGRK